MNDFFDYYVKSLRAEAESTGESAEAAKQLLEMHNVIEAHCAVRGHCTVLELGVDRGQSTRVFLNALRQRGRLVSIDIRDCSLFAAREDWTFVQGDSTDTDNTLQAAPFLKDGIDILYVDSLHELNHVIKETQAWWPLMNADSHLFFDDISTGPYKVGARKDSASTEINNAEILDYIQRLYFSNTESMSLQVLYGSTGLACVTKHSPRGHELLPCTEAPIRRRRWYWGLRRRLGVSKSYDRKEDGSDFLVPIRETEDE